MPFTIVKAQNTDSAKIISLEGVVVTANKIPQKQNTTGKVISVISKEQLSKSVGKTVAQVLNEQAGITINGALNNLGANETIYMRGASSGRTLILMDGIPLSDPSNINNEFDINLLSINNIERIEICRGSQSTLYGSDALAGVINIITTNDNANKPINAKVSLAGGNYGTFRGNVQLYGKTNNLNYHVKYAKLYSNGFSSAFDSSYKKSFANNPYNGDIFSASINYAVNEFLSFRPYIQNSHYKTNLDAGAFADEKDYTVGNNSLISGLSTQYSKNDLRITINYQYNKTKRNYLNDSIDVPGFVKYSTDNYVGETQFAEVYSSYKISKHVSFLEGADHRFNSFHSLYKSISSFGPYSSSFKDTLLSQSSLYGSLLLNFFTNKLNIEFGGRLNVHSRYGSNSTFTFNPSYSFNEHWRLFGSIESGFKAPSLYQLYSAYGNRKLLPETSKTYEAGIQQSCEKISTRLVYFNRDIHDGLDFNYNNFTYYNFNRQQVNGLELELVIKPLKGLELSANYSYIDPKENTQSHITFKDTTYSYLLRRPKNTLNVRAAYTIKNLYISVSGKYAGERYDAKGYKQADALLDSYFILGAYAEYKLDKHFKIFTDIQNITNKKFFDIRGYNSIPFLINGGISLSF